MLSIFSPVPPQCQAQGPSGSKGPLLASPSMSPGGQNIGQGRGCPQTSVASSPSGEASAIRSPHQQMFSGHQCVLGERWGRGALRASMGAGNGQGGRRRRVHCRGRGQHKQSPGSAKEHSEPQRGKTRLERRRQRGAWYEIRRNGGRTRLYRRSGWESGLHPPKPQAMKRTQGRVMKALPSEIPPKPGEERSGRGSEWTPCSSCIVMGTEKHQ